MGSFWGGDSAGKVKYSDLHHLLREVPHLEEKHRERVVGRFEHLRESGISKEEIRHEINEMIQDPNDGITPDKARQIRDHLYGAADGHHEEAA